MNILCDQCVNTDVINVLRTRGFDVVHTSNVKLSRSDDKAVFSYAQKSRRILLTFDRDFGNITQFAIRNAYGVVIFYIDQMSKQEIIQRVLYTFEHSLKNRDCRRSLFIVDSKSIRVWPK